MLRDYQIIAYEFNPDILVIHQNDDVWVTQKQIADLFEADGANISRHISNILNENEVERSGVVNFTITASDGKRYGVKHYNLEMVIAIGSRVKSPKATEFRKWAIKIIKDYLLKGVAVNPVLAEQNPELVQDNFDLQFLPSMKKHINKHAHTLVHQTERLDNIQKRKQVNGHLARTAIDTPKYGEINAKFLKSLTGKTKREILAGYEHALKSSSAIDAVGSFTLRQLNMLMEAVSLVLQHVESDSLASDVQKRQVERLIDRYGEPLRQYAEMLSQDTGQPIDKLGENTHKQRLL